MERTLVLVKPDGVQRGLIGEIITRFENRGLRLVAAKFMKVSPDLASKHYAVHKGKAFYDNLIQFITSAPVMAMVWAGPDAIAAVRQTVGKTRGTEAAPGTIRHDYALQARYNLTHASDSPENAEAEIALWFSPDELVDWKRCTEEWMYE
jgi:nucleoside-diphosphate kinase